MIVRLLTDGQYRVSEDVVKRLNGLDDQATTCAADSRIDDRKVHRTPAEVSRPREQHERTGEDVEPRHLMRDVDEHGRRAPGEDDALHRRDQG